jgi:hypothetical protein
LSFKGKTGKAIVSEQHVDELAARSKIAAGLAGTP